MPYRDVDDLRTDEFEAMLEGLTARAQREQGPLAQLAYMIGPSVGVKGLEQADYYTGYAREAVRVETYNPPWLERALQVGLKLGAVSDQAFITLRSVRL